MIPTMAEHHDQAAPPHFLDSGRRLPACAGMHRILADAGGPSDQRDADTGHRVVARTRHALVHRDTTRSSSPPTSRFSPRWATSSPPCGPESGGTPCSLDVQCLASLSLARRCCCQTGMPPPWTSWPTPWARPLARESLWWRIAGQHAGRPPSRSAGTPALEGRTTCRNGQCPRRPETAKGPVSPPVGKKRSLWLATES